MQCLLFDRKSHFPYDITDFSNRQSDLVSSNVFRVIGCFQRFNFPFQSLHNTSRATHYYFSDFVRQFKDTEQRLKATDNSSHMDLLIHLCAIIVMNCFFFNDCQDAIYNLFWI